MAETITEWQKIQFGDNVKYVYAQTEPMFTRYFAPEDVKSDVQGKRISFPVVGNMVARDKTQRHEQTQWGDLEKSVRWIVPYASYQALPLDNFDQVRSCIANQNSVHTRRIVESLRRAEDLRGITAAIGTAIQGEAAGTSIALPSSQIVALGTTPDDVLTLAKIKAVSAIFDKEGGTDRHWFYSPGQKSAILAITQAASSDFTARRIYDKGDIDGDEWMGFMWHRMGDVRTQGAVAAGNDTTNSTLSTLMRMLPLLSTTRTNIAYCRGAMGKGFCENLVTHLDQLPQITYTWQAYGELDVDCVRILDGLVASILCLEQ
jgi:hypothetical protein